jgi:hypothetical protein
MPETGLALAIHCRRFQYYRGLNLTYADQSAG